MSLIDHTLFGIEDKVAIAIDRIRAYTPAEGLYVAFSGGKDSIVLLDLVRRAGVKHDAHFNVTTVDPPELIQFIRENYPTVEWHRPEMNMAQLIVKKRMPPTRKVRYCCEILKEGGGKGRLVATGVRWEESSKRGNRKLVEKCFKGGGKRYLNAIIDWTDSDVWQYICENKMSYCRLYDEGFSRLGCVGCPMAGKNRRIEFARWPGFERMYRTAFQKCYDNREVIGLGNKSWKNGDEMFDWWMDEKREKDNPDQGVLFE